MITNRVAKLRRMVAVDTQRLRGKALRGLEELFDLAEKMAKDEKVKPKQRQMWVRVAAYTAQIMNSVASGFDEKQIDVQLEELERLISEVKAKAKTGKPERRVEETAGSEDSQGPS